MVALTVNELMLKLMKKDPNAFVFYENDQGGYEPIMGVGEGCVFHTLEKVSTKYQELKGSESVILKSKESKNNDKPVKPLTDRQKKYVSKGPQHLN